MFVEGEETKFLILCSFADMYSDNDGDLLALIDISNFMKNIPNSL